MKHVDINEIVSAVPIQMTRSEKLRHWAELVRKHKGSLFLYHLLEYTKPSLLRKITICYDTSFWVAALDSAFQRQGLKANATIQDIMDFFEVTQAELHEFSCDCGGIISNQDMADRIEWLAE